jgi:hypothetical protein
MTKKEANVTKNDAKGAIIRMIIGGILLFGGAIAAFSSLWLVIPAIIGWFLVVYSFWGYLLIKDPVNPANRK